MELERHTESDWTEHWIVEENGLWYFYDPSNDKFGPYTSKVECKKALLKYEY